MPDDPMAYEARFGWNRRNVIVVALGLGALAFAVAKQFGADRYPLWASALLGLLGVIVLAGVTAMAANRRVALRADESGLTLVGSPLRSAMVTLHFPWPSIEAIVLWGEKLPGGKGNLSHIGVRLREGTPSACHDPKAAFFWKTAQDMAPGGAPPQLVDASVSFGSWRWDLGRLDAAVAHYSPGLTIERHLY
jgi:hypothetical protein